MECKTYYRAIVGCCGREEVRVKFKRLKQLSKQYVVESIL
jgi:hypothetical protein